MNPQTKHLNFIDGKWCEGSTGKWEPNTNPAKPAEVLGQTTQSSAEDMKRAIDVAASKQHEWAKTPRPVRGAIIQRAAEIIKKRVDEFAMALTREEGKNLSESRGEVLKAVNVLEFTASEARRPTGEVIPSEMPNTFIYTTRVPMGVVGIITPWNFPVCIPAWKVAPALVEGNTVVLKPAEQTPATAEMVVKAFEEAGLPAGVLNMVHGDGPTVGQPLVHDERIKVVSFTGSNDVGRMIYEQAAKRMARVQLEMGGKNPVIVLDDANIDNAVAATVMGAFGSTGQRCTATSRVVIDRKVHKEFVSKLVEKVRAIKVGNGLTDTSCMGPSIDENQMNIVLRAIELAKKQGSKLLCGGERVNIDGGYFVAPTVFDEVSPKSSLAQNEAFGPVLAIIPVENTDEAFEVANGVRYGLSSSVYTSNYQRVMQYAETSEAGMLHVNSATVGGEAQAPFGGLKETGIGGREMGSTANEIFCEIKTVYFDYNQSVRKGNLY